MIHVVKLELHEFALVIQCGTARHLEAIKGRYRRNHSSKKDDQLTTDIYSTGAECAVAKHLQRYWHMGVNTFKSVPDVAPDIEVRSTDLATGRLILRKDDPAERPYVLVYWEKAAENMCPKFWILGWICGRDGMQPEWIDNPGSDEESYWVPQSALSDVDALRFTPEELEHLQYGHGKGSQGTRTLASIGSVPNGGAVCTAPSGR